MRYFLRIAAHLTALLFLLAGAAFAQQKANIAEKELFDSANRERTARGLSALKWAEPLTQAARKHALLMVQRNAISHQFPGEPELASRTAEEGARFSVIAENVAEGPSTAIIHSGWMKSPPHRANLLDPDLDSIGIGVAERRGQFFAVEDFSRVVANLTLEEQEKQVGELLEARGLELLDGAGDARQVCAGSRKNSGKRRPLALVRYEASDLGVLPDNLVEKIKGGRYRAAAVGACVSGITSGFSYYRVAVLLYSTR